MYPPSVFDQLNLKGWWYGTVEYQYPPHQRLGSYAEEGRSVNFMKVGLAHVHAFTSPMFRSYPS